jgi:hypothetical protein
VRAGQKYQASPGLRGLCKGVKSLPREFRKQALGMRVRMKFCLFCLHRHRLNCLVVHVLILHQSRVVGWESVAGRKIWSAGRAAGFGIHCRQRFTLDRDRIARRPPPLCADFKHRRIFTFGSIGTILEASEY